MSTESPCLPPLSAREMLAVCRGDGRPGAFVPNTAASDSHGVTNRAAAATLTEPEVEESDFIDSVSHRPERSIVFHAYGSTGDILPLLAIARALREAGYRVLFIANAFFRKLVESSGVAFEEAGTVEEQLSALERGEDAGNTDAGALLRYQALVHANYSRVTSILERLVRDGESLLVVTHGEQSPVMPACERYGIPVVLAHHSPAQVLHNREDFVTYRGFFGTKEWRSRYLDYPMQLLRRELNNDARKDYLKWRRENGLPRPGLRRAFGLVCGRRRWCLHKNVALELGLFPRWFAEPVGHAIRDVKFCGFVFHESAPANHDSIMRFIAERGAPIVFTPGTAVEDVDAFCAVVQDTSRLLRAPAIVLSRFASRYLREYAESGAGQNVLVVDYAALDFLLPKSRLLVHHGGIGTLAEALRTGIPQIMRPRMYDQPNNALRAVMRGIGGMLYDGGYTANQISSVYRYLTSSNVHRRNLSHYSRQVRAFNGANSACKHIMVLDRKLGCGNPAARSIPTPVLQHGTATTA